MMNIPSQTQVLLLATKFAVRVTFDPVFIMQPLT